MANEDKKKVLIDVLVNSAEAIKSLAKLVDETDELKQKQKELDKSTESGREAFENLGTQIRTNNKDIQARRKLIDNDVKGSQLQGDSLNAVAQSLSYMKARYRDMSEEVRNSDVGVALQKSILGTNTALQAAENAYGDYYRTVGQYSKYGDAFNKEILSLNENIKDLSTQFLALSDQEKQSEFGQSLITQMNGISERIDQTKSAYDELGAAQQQYQSQITGLVSGNNQLVGSLLQTASSGQGVGAMFKAAGVQAAAFGKSLLALLANPIVAIIAAIVAVVMLLVQAFKRNEENATKLNAVIGKLTGVFSWLLDKLEPIASFLVDVLIFAFDQLTAQIEKTIDGIVSVMDFLGMDTAAKWVKDQTNGIKEMSNAARDLAKQEGELTKAQREAKKTQLDYQTQAEKLRQIRDDGTKSIKDRIKANDDLGNILKKQLQDELKIAELELSVANQRLTVSGKTAENLDAQAAAMEKKADILERVTGTESEKLRANVSLRKEAADNAYNLMQKTLASKKALDEALIKAEGDYQSQDFNKKIAYAKRLNDLSVSSQKAQLDLQRKYGKLTQSEFDIQIKTLEAGQTEFSNTQITEVNNYFKQQRAEISKMVAATVSDQIKDVKEKYAKAIKSLGEIAEPIKIVGQSDEEYEKELKKHKEFMFNRSKIEYSLQKEQQKEIDAINEDNLQKRVTEIETAYNKLYNEDLTKYTDNEREKTRLTIEQLEKQIAAKKRANEGKEDGELDMSVLDDEAKLRAARAQANQIQLNSELLKSNENARAKYLARKKYLEAESKIYKDNADKQLEIAKSLSDNEKDFAQSRIDSIVDYADKALELLGGLSSFMSANEEAELQKYEEDNNRKKEVLQERLDSGTISQAVYDREVARLDKELEKKQAEIARKQAIREKAMNVFSVGLNTAAAIMKNTAQLGLLPAIPVNILTGALGAAQLATILATPLPKAAKGMYIQGASHTNGGKVIEAEGGETIINKRSSSAYLPLLSAINEAGGGVPFTRPMSDGGFAMRVNSGSSQLSKADLIEAFTEASKSTKIIATIEDINRASNAYKNTIEMFNY